MSQDRWFLLDRTSGRRVPIEEASQEQLLDCLRSILPWFEGQITPEAMHARAQAMLDVMRSTPPPVDRGVHHAALRMLLRRASLLDRWRAMRNPGHWIHKARRDLAGAPQPRFVDDFLRSLKGAP